MSRSQPQPRSQFKVFMPMQTRWSDNDVYGHINNVVYYSYFDTAVNQFLIEQGLLDIQHSQIIGLVVATQCEYFTSIAYPDALEIGIAVMRLGRSSVHYELGVFQQDRKSTRLNSSHVAISYAVFCLKKKKEK